MESEEVEHIEISLGGIDSDEINAEVEAEFNSMLDEMATWEEAPGELEVYEPEVGLLYEEEPSTIYEDIEWEEIKYEEMELEINVGMDELAYEVEGYEGMEELEEEGGEILGEAIPLVMSKKEITKRKEAGQDVVLEKEIEDAMFRGMWVAAGLMELEMATWEDTMYGEGEKTPIEEAVDFGLITQAQADKQTTPRYTMEEIIKIIEQGPIIQMFETSTLVALDAEELILSNVLMTAGRPDLLDHIISLEEDEHWKINTIIGGGYLVENPDATFTGVCGIGGRLQRKLDALKEENEGERFEGGGEAEEERGCIGGIIDEKTCAGCLSAIGTCGPMSELAKPPFHDHCRCDIYRQ